MPRFLNTWTGEFLWVDDPAKAAYAILSHTWLPVEDGGEQSYDDLRRLQDEVRASGHEEPSNTTAPSILSSSNSTGDGPDLFVYRQLHPERDSTPSVGCNASRSTVFSHPRLSKKIEGICNVVRKAGYRLLWDDTCCIDKSSSAELTEAINCMYEWYRLADVCYVYLQDVPDDDDPFADMSYFRRSVWHERGWTLQELIAPNRVVFLAQSWRVLGTKISLASILNEITGIDLDILTGRRRLDSVSVARRMSWAASRKTTRLEDGAYSLLGIFGVHMSTIYGEGENAFLRLQEEIIRTIPDQSIFAWGPDCTIMSLREPGGSWGDGGVRNHGLLAQSPCDFKYSGDVTALSPKQFLSRLGRRMHKIPQLHGVFTAQGVRLQLLCVDLARIPHIQALLDRSTRRASRGVKRAHALALLQCQDDQGSLLALPLCDPPNEGFAREGLLITTHCSWNDDDDDPIHTIRLTKNVLAEALRYLLPTPIEVFLRRYHHAESSVVAEAPLMYPEEAGRSPLPVYCSADVSFRIAPHCYEELGTLGFTLDPLARPIRTDDGSIVLSTSLRSNPLHPRWKGTLQQVIQLRLRLTSGEDVTWKTASFFIQNRFIDAAYARDSNPPASACDSSRLSLCGTKYSHVAETAPFPDDSDGTRRVEYSSTRLRPNLVVATADFLVYGDTEWSNDTCLVRILRVALQRPRESLWSLCRDLWLSVDISGLCTHTKSRAEMPDSLSSSPQHSLKGADVADEIPTEGVDAPKHCLDNADDADEVPMERVHASGLPRADGPLEGMRTQFAELSSQVSMLSSQIAGVLSRIEALERASRSTH